MHALNRFKKSKPEVNIIRILRSISIPLKILHNEVNKMRVFRHLDNRNRPLTTLNILYFVCLAQKYVFYLSTSAYNSINDRQSMNVDVIIMSKKKGEGVRQCAIIWTYRLPRKQAVYFLGIRFIYVTFH